MTHPRAPLRAFPIWERGAKRVLAVVKTARALQLTSNPLTTRIHTRDRGGICHQLANDGKVRWVK